MIFLNLGLILIGIGILGIITGLTYDNAVFGIAWLVSCTLFIIGINICRMKNIHLYQKIFKNKQTF